MNTIPWNKGKPCSQETRLNISLAKRRLINQPKPCACGCGKLTNHGKKWVHGHNLRINNPIDDMSVRSKISKTKVGTHNSPKTEFKKGNVPWWIKRNLPHPTRDPLVLDKIKAYRLNQIFPKVDTEIEIKLQDALKAGNINFITHYPILGQPDIAFPKMKVAIFVDGCYWHGCPVCGFDALRPNHDGRVTSQLEGKGWTVLRFWEHEVEGDLKRCVNKIQEVLENKYWMVVC